MQSSIENQTVHPIAPFHSADVPPCPDHHVSRGVWTFTDALFRPVFRRSWAAGTGLECSHGLVRFHPLPDVAALVALLALLKACPDTCIMSGQYRGAAADVDLYPANDPHGRGGQPRIPGFCRPDRSRAGPPSAWESPALAVDRPRGQRRTSPRRPGLRELVQVVAHPVSWDGCAPSGSIRRSASRSRARRSSSTWSGARAAIWPRVARLGAGAVRQMGGLARSGRIVPVGVASTWRPRQFRH